MTRHYLELEKEGAPFEELEKLTLGGLRRAVVDGDVKTGSVMSGQIAGMVKDEKSCKEILDRVPSVSAWARIFMKHVRKREPSTIWHPS